MAQRRMFSPDIVSSDAFLDMPVSSQALYFHLGMAADDDGFVNPKRVLRTVGAGDDDLKVLLAKRFLLAFEDGVVVIKHWLIHNLIRHDRYKPTQYLEHKKTLNVKENKAYTEISEEWQPNGNQMAPQVRLGKVKETTGAKLQIVAMPDEDKPQREKKERVIPLPYSWEKTRDAWRVENRRYLRVLGWYLSRKDLWPTLTSEGRVSATLARLKSIAVKIAEGEWTSDELNAAYERIAANPKLSTEWTLETVEKYLTK